MAVMGWSQYSCPHCAQTFDDADIVRVHSSHACPICNRPLNINAEKALARGPFAAFLTVSVIGIVAVGSSLALRAFGVTDSFFQMRSWPEPKVVAAILPLVFLATIVVVGVGAASLVVKTYARLRLSAVREAVQKKPVETPVPSPAQMAELRQTYSALATSELQALLKRPWELLPGAADLIRSELERRPRGRAPTSP